MRLIDGDALKEELEYYIAKVGCSDPHNEALKWCMKFIDNKPTIEPEMHVPEIIGCKEAVEIVEEIVAKIKSEHDDLKHFVTWQTNSIDVLEVNERYGFVLIWWEFYIRDAE